MTYIGVKLEKEDAEMLNTILRKLPKFRMKKDAVLVEALHTYYQNQERVKFKG